MADRRLTDPLKRTIVLHDHTWYGHIIKGHPEVASERSWVERAVSSPKEIRVSASDPNCRIYYGAAATSGRELAVVADVVTGVVKTAYATTRRRSGAVEWSR